MDKTRQKSLNRSKSTVRSRQRSDGANKEEQLPYEITIAILGGPQVGKSAIASQFLWEGFVSDYKPTVEEFNWVEFEMTLGGRLMLQIIDSSGSRDFIAMRNLYVRTADAFIIVFSVEDPLSFEEAKAIIQDIKIARINKVPIILLANKCDLYENRKGWRVKGVEKYSMSESIRVMEATAKKRDQELPSFVETLDSSKKNIIKGLWQIESLSISDKIDSIDEISKSMPIASRKEYRRWRFLNDRERLPKFVEYQDVQIRTIIQTLFDKFTDLDEFAKLVHCMKKSLTNVESFEQWLESESIDIAQLTTNDNASRSLSDFIAELNMEQQTSIKDVWNSNTLTLSEKIARIDALENKMSGKTRREYRRWRFEHDKSSVNAFIEKQNPTIQKHIRLCLSTQPNLDEFYNSMLALLPSFDDKEAFINWANSEMCNRILFYLTYGENPNYEGRICLFNSSTFEVEIVEKFSTWVWPCEVAIGNDKIFLLDGWKEVFEIFNYETKQLTKGPDPPEWRKWATVAYYKDELYYIGGYSNCVNILVDGKWQRGPDFPIEIVEARHVICNDKLYIISKNAVFQLSDDEREWIEVGKMKGGPWWNLLQDPAMRQNHAVASLNGKIYITGGYDSVYNTFNSCLCFDPSQPFDRRFTSIANMNYKRKEHSLFVANGKLYAIGGYQECGPSKFCKSVEEYDPTTNQWRIVRNIE